MSNKIYNSSAMPGGDLYQESDAIDYEALYRKETGEDIRPMDDLTREWTIVTGKYYRWLKNKLSDRDNLLALAKARFRAGEELRMKCFHCAYKKEGVRCGICIEFEKWNQSVAAYDKAVNKTQGEKE